MKRVTVHNLNNCTKQEVLDFIASNLLRQNKKSFHSGNCAYRGKDGCKCAAGFLIPDEEYTPDMEGRGWRTLTSEFFPRVAENTNYWMVAAMQSIHDQFPPEEWEGQLRTLAIKGQLQWYPSTLRAIDTYED